MVTKVKSFNARMLNGLRYMVRWVRAVFLFEVFVSFLIIQFCISNFQAQEHTIQQFIGFIMFFQIGYYAVYIINDILDYQRDKNNPAKQDKPLVTGVVDKQTAWLLVLILVAVGIGGSFLFASWRGVVLLVFILIYNVIYTVEFKKVFYIRVITNGFTHFYRILLPFIFFHIPINAYLILAGYFWFIVSVTLLHKFKMEKKTTNYLYDSIIPAILIFIFTVFSVMYYDCSAIKFFIVATWIYTSLWILIPVNVRTKLMKLMNKAGM